LPHPWDGRRDEIHLDLNSRRPIEKVILMSGALEYGILVFWAGQKEKGGIKLPGSVG
jgi:hypothetical protein